MRILVAPDKFKGTLQAGEICAAIERAARTVWTDLETRCLPMADGGEGTAAALSATLGGWAESLDLGEEQPSVPFTRLADGRCVLELSTCARLSSRPLGALYEHTAVAGAALGVLMARDEPVIVAVGGTTSTDGGTGAACSCGWRFLDRAGRPLPPGGGPLRDLARIESGTVPPDAGPKIVAACDVDNPLCGPRGAARVFAPQKGASPEEVEVLAEGLEVLNRRLVEDVGVDISGAPGAGAGGGMGAGLHAFFGAELISGAELVARASGLEEAIASADLVVTGEGRIDASSFRGKVLGHVADLCRRRGVTCLAVAGEVRATTDELRGAGVRDHISLVAGHSDAAAAVMEAAIQLFSRFEGR